MVVKQRKVLMLVFILLIVITGCTVKSDTGNIKNKYIIDVYYRPEELSIFASQRLLYRNTEDVEQKNIYFHTYPNAFREEETAPMIGSISDNYPKGFNSGQIDIVSVKIDKSPVSWTVQGKDKTILAVRPDKPIGINEKVEITIDFQEKIPEARTDFGSYKGVACFENWYPVICVYDNDGWHLEPSSRTGEANFSEIADYEVQLNLPKDQVVASSGKCIKEKREEDRKVITLRADNVRDFTWAASDKFKKAERRIGKVTVSSYFLEEDEARGIQALDYGVRAIEFFSNTFGEYPYDSFKIVETYLYGGAMEYPLLTSIGEQYYKHSDEKALEGAVSHEIAHQWWYVTVGNNEYKEPWLDEALASYSEAMYFEKYYGEEVLNNKVYSQAGLMRFERSVGDSMDKFRTGSEYNIVVYMKGSYLIDKLRKRIGDEKFIKVMKTYYANYMLKNATSEDFIGVIDEVCKDSTASDFRSWIFGDEDDNLPAVDYPENVINS